MQGQEVLGPVTSELRQSRDPDRGQGARRWSSDLGQGIVDHALRRQHRVESFDDQIAMRSNVDGGREPVPGRGTWNVRWSGVVGTAPVRVETGDVGAL